MGLFSWKYADVPQRLKCGKEGYLIMPDNSYYHTQFYDGYGNFGSMDVYEAVLDMNRKHLNSKMLDIPVYEHCVWDGNEERFEKELKQYMLLCRCLWAYRNGASDDEMEILFGNNEWKRELGIAIACYDKQNKSLPFPIKITSKPVLYASVPYSKTDP